MQILRQKPTESQSPYNYIPCVTFEMVECNKIKSIELGSHMRFKLVNKVTQLSNSPECQFLQDYSTKAAKRMHESLNSIAESQKIQYSIPQNNNKLIASVYQAHYAFADGPKENIDYLGTRGVATCIALAMVVKTEEQRSRVVVGHLDSRNNIEGSIDEAMTRLEAAGQEISAYVLSEKEDRVDENVFLTVKTLQEKGIKWQLDLSDDRLIINLRSGLPVKSLRTNQEVWLVPDLQLKNALDQSNFAFIQSPGKPIRQNARKEYDLTARPVGYIERHMPD
jgi:hypothetical protein